MRAPAPARNVSVSFLMSISSQRNPKYERLNQGTRSKKVGNGHRHGTKLLMELSATMFPIGNVAPGSFKEASTVLLFASQQILPSISRAIVMTSTLIAP